MALTTAPPCKRRRCTTGALGADEVFRFVIGHPCIRLNGGQTLCSITGACMSLVEMKWRGRTGPVTIEFIDSELSKYAPCKAYGPKLLRPMDPVSMHSFQHDICEILFDTVASPDRYIRDWLEFLMMGEWLSTSKQIFQVFDLTVCLTDREHSLELNFPEIMPYLFKDDTDVFEYEGLSDCDLDKIDKSGKYLQMFIDCVIEAPEIPGIDGWNAKDLIVQKWTESDESE